MNGKSNILNQSVGKRVTNNNNFQGRVAGLMHDRSSKELQYIILKSGECFGRGERFFAIPANSTLIDITKGGRIIIQLKKDDLQFAQGISADECPRPNRRHGLSVFELYGYDEKQQKATASS